jgi:predicted DCC family thiol-disulfide oxidoreductase YuxK
MQMVLVLYDGVCALCNGLVKFVVKRDRRDRFRFAPLQEELARGIVTRHGGDPDQLDTMYVVLTTASRGEGAEAWAVALATIRNVGGAWSLMGVFAIPPSFVLDFFYGLVAAGAARCSAGSTAPGAAAGAAAQVPVALLVLVTAQVGQHASAVLRASSIGLGAAQHSRPKAPNHRAG